MEKNKTLQKLKNLRKDQQITQAHQLLKTARQNQTESILLSGCALGILRQSKAWQQELPESSWSQFLNYEYGLTSMEASRYIYAYETFIEKFQLPLEQLAQIRYHSRLYTSLKELERGGVLTAENASEWIQKARDLPPPQWKDEVEEVKGETMCYHQNTKVVVKEITMCQDCNYSLSSKQYDKQSN